MCKAIRINLAGINYTYDETLVVPIIENTLEERDLRVRIFVCGKICFETP